MSLLNDALKRAKLEALEREADNQTSYGLPTLPSQQSPRRAPLVALVMLVLVLAAVGAWLGWRVGRQRHAATAAATPQVAARVVTEAGGAQSQTSVTEVAGPQAGEGIASKSGIVAAPARNQATETVVARPDAEDEASATVPPQGPSVVATATTPDLETRQQQAPAKESVGEVPDNGATYVRILEAGGERLELQGIAFQGTSSVAIINELMVSRDDMVGGFLIVAIEPERVQLQRGGVTFYLALH